jgi:hypothetical protein
MTGNTQAGGIWQRFCNRFGVERDLVPLFQADETGIVASRICGRGASARPVLVRSPQMEARVISETSKLVDDWKAGRHRHDGLIYAMGYLDEFFVPLYIGKTETLGKREGNLSANLRNLTTDRSKFARWGDNYAYHIGDLSACALLGHAPEKRTGKYEVWARTLFEHTPSASPQLRRPLFFWTMAWDSTRAGIWEELGPTPLAFLEYLLIGVASFVSPELLNREGIARRVAKDRLRN